MVSVPRCLAIKVDYGKRTNIEWEVETGTRLSSPIVTDGKIYYSTVVNEGATEAAKKGLYFGGNRAAPPKGVHHWLIICRDLTTGKLEWKKEVHHGIPSGSIHVKNSFASETAVTDGENLYVSFGHLGIFCVDLKGELIWQRRGKASKTRYDWGTRSSVPWRHVFYCRRQ